MVRNLKVSRKILTGAAVLAVSVACMYGCGGSEPETGTPSSPSVQTEAGAAQNTSGVSPADQAGGGTALPDSSYADEQMPGQEVSDSEIGDFAVTTGVDTEPAAGSTEPAARSTEPVPESTENGADSTVQFGNNEEYRPERPTYTASDYVSMNPYTRPVFQQTAAEEVTDAFIDAELAVAAGRAGYSTSAKDVYALTDADAATISGQKYQTISDLRLHLKDMLSVRAQLDAVKESFYAGISEYSSTLSISGLPEEVLAYDEMDMDQEILEDAADIGIAETDVEAIKESTQIDDHLDSEYRDQLTLELITRYIAEMEGISATDTDIEEMCTLYMTAYGLDSKEEVLATVSENDLMNMALQVKIYNTCVAQ